MDPEQRREKIEAWRREFWSSHLTQAVACVVHDVVSVGSSCGHDGVGSPKMQFKCTISAARAALPGQNVRIIMEKLKDSEV